MSPVSPIIFYAWNSASLRRVFTPGGCFGVFKHSDSKRHCPGGPLRLFPQILCASLGSSLRSQAASLRVPHRGWRDEGKDSDPDISVQAAMVPQDTAWTCSRKQLTRALPGVQPNLITGTCGSEAPGQDVQGIQATSLLAAQ